MALGLDSSQALRSNAQLVALVEAIMAAPTTEPETDAIEWKREYDLRAKPQHRFGVAKHILGFGNRKPDQASAEFEGCGYLVLGVAPQVVAGVAVEDPADLENWIGAYVGRDRPVWHADYVKVQGVNVLVITIEPPRWGDTVHTLQKGYDHAQAGRVFVRRNGQTEEAAPSEMHMLVERAKRAASRIKVDLGMKDPGRKRYTYVTTPRERVTWINREQVRLARRDDDPPGYRDTPARLAPLVALSADRRSRETYDREVEEYISQAGRRWHALVLEAAIAQRLAPVELVISNASEENFAAVQVELHVPDGAYPFFDREDPHKLLDAPQSPNPWGTEQITSFLHVESPRVDAGGTVTEQQGKAFHVAFDPVHVRPYASQMLAPLYLAIPSAKVQGDELRMRWNATSTSAAAAVDGEIVVPLSRDPVPAAQLVDAVT